MNKDRLLELFKLHIQEKLSKKEESEFLNEIYSMSDEQRESLIDEFIDKLPVEHHLGKADAEKIFRNIVRPVTKGRTFFVRFSISVAASLVIAFSGFYIADKYYNSSEDTISVVNDIAPGGEKAILTLADGSVVRLEGSSDSILVSKKNDVTIQVKDNKLLYKKDPKAQAREIKYNMLSIPRGGEFQMVLPDGTNVWLNAESSIKFPDEFPSDESPVMITGEVYFEVTKMSGEKPFIVEFKDKARIEVLGTRFNVNAYENEGSVRTTLVEGSVKVVSPLSKNSSVISPGQQATITGDGLLSVKEVDVDEVIAWKNGKFVFDKANIQTIMRQIERWYNVDVVYSGTYTKHYGGAISRKVNLSRFFEILELSGELKFGLNDSTVTVQEK